MLKQAFFCISIKLCLLAPVLGQVFSENFGTLSNSTALTTSNTNFSYIRTGSGGGGITALNSSNISSGASMFLDGPSSGSLNGVGNSSLTSSNVTTFIAKIRFG